MQQRDLFELGVERFFKALPEELRKALITARMRMVGPHDRSTEWETLSEIFYNAAQIFSENESGSFGKLDVHSTIGKQSADDYDDYIIDLKLPRHPTALTCKDMATILLRTYNFVYETAKKLGGPSRPNKEIHFGLNITLAK